MNMPPDLPLSPQDWEQTPLPVQTLVILLWQENQALKQQVATLQAEVAKLREQVNRNSHNSSQPPSSDPPQKRTYPKREPSGQKPGGQPGHPGCGRKLQPVVRVSRVVVSKPVICQACGAVLLGEDAHPQRHQVSELPRIEPEIVEYQRHTLTCGACGAQNQAEWPTEMPSGSFGERLQATIGYRSGRFGISQRDIQEMLATLFQVEISLGSIPAQEQCVSRAIEQPVAEAEQYVQQQSVVNLDETGWQQWTQNFWLWVCTTPLVTVFRVFQTRGADGKAQLLGADYPGIVGSDRYSAYNNLDPDHRQVCWSHLKRDFQALVERGGESQTIGRLLLVQVARIFALWHQVCHGSLSRVDFQTAMQPVRQEVSALLHIGTFVKHCVTRRTCQNILRVEPSLWTFVDREGVEPTHKAAERALRRGVIWRRRSFGTQSERGSRFVERILTAVTTLRQQKRDVLDFLTEACQARILESAPPSLLLLAL